MTLLKIAALDLLWLVASILILPVSIYRRLRHGRPLGNWRQRLFGLAPQLDASTHTVWVHAVSVGEVNQLATLLPRLRQQYPDTQFAISVTTATGMQLARETFADIPRFYFPMDFSWAVGSVLRRVRPDVLILTELEVWPNLTGMATRQGVKVVVINGRLSEKSFRGYSGIRPLVNPCFSRLQLVIAQTETYARRFRQLGCPDVRVAGSIKFDGAAAPANPQLARELASSIALAPDDVLWIAGSTQEPEEVMAAQIWRDLRGKFPQLRLVIVPRHPHRGKSIGSQLETAGVRSELRSSGASPPCDRDAVLISDTIGELFAWWSLASIAFVGGSFGSRGGQNMIEPAANGAAVCFGPHTWNFARTVELMLQAEVAVQVDNETELRQFVQRCLSDGGFASELGGSAQRLVASQTGAVDRTVHWLAPMLSWPASSPSRQAA